jgi:hypothetical protein
LELCCKNAGYDEAGKILTTIREELEKKEGLERQTKEDYRKYIIKELLEDYQVWFKKEMREIVDMRNHAKFDEWDTGRMIWGLNNTHKWNGKICSAELNLNYAKNTIPRQLPREVCDLILEKNQILLHKVDEERMNAEYKKHMDWLDMKADYYYLMMKMARKQLPSMYHPKGN